MPIRASQKQRYPKNWREISRRIRERAGNCCEGAPRLYPDCRAVNGQPHPVTGSIVVLTVAHLNHEPENCSDDNLAALCQRCHLTYDAKHHARNAAETRRRRRAVGDLFEMEAVSSRPTRRVCTSSG